MGFVRKWLKRTEVDPREAVATALATAEEGRSAPEIGGDPAKNRELAGLIEILRATEAGLRTGKDREDRPVSPSELGDRLGRTLGYLRQRGIWARLNADAGRETRSKLGRLEKEVEAAVKALRE